MSVMVLSPEDRTLTELIRALPGEPVLGAQKDESVSQLEESLDLEFPDDYRRFLRSYGAFASQDVRIFGVGAPGKFSSSVSEMTSLLRFCYPDFGPDYVAVEKLGKSHWACFRAVGPEPDAGSVFAYDPTASGQPVITLSPSFTDYLRNRLVALLPEEGVRRPINSRPNLGHEDEIRALKWHVSQFDKKFKYDHVSGGRLPRNHQWRPYRFCIQDVVLGVVVVRHDRERNSLEVAVFLSANLPEYPPLSETLALTSFLLSEAYKCGGSMELVFSGNVERGQVPRQLRELATQYGVDVAQEHKDRITADEAHKLYAAITGFSAKLKSKLNELDRLGLIRTSRACYLVHNGVWTKDQLEMIVRGSERPEGILSGTTTPNNRHLYQHDLIHAQAALLGDMLDRTLSRRDRGANGEEVLDLEGDVLGLTISFDETYYAKVYRSSEQLSLPWCVSDFAEHHIEAGCEFRVLIRPRATADLARHLSVDVNRAVRCQQAEGVPTFLAVTRDFFGLSADEQQDWVEKARGKSVNLLVCPEYVSTLQAEAMQKLARSRILRQ